MKRARLIIVDDHAVVRAGIRSMLAVAPEFEVVGEGATGGEAFTLVERIRPELVLLDMRLPDVSGPEVCRRIKEMSPSTMVLFLSSFSDSRTVLAALEAGADGYLLKEVGGQDIVAALRQALAGNATYSSRVQEIVRNRIRPGVSDPMDQLSPQDLRIMECVARGMMNKEISGHLGLADGTVRNYLSSIFEKLGVQSRAEAAVMFVRYQETQGGTTGALP